MRRIPIMAYEDGNTSLLLYWNVLSAPADAKAGTDYAEMCQVIPIIEKVAGATDELVLAEPEWGVLCDRLKVTKFAMNTSVTKQAIDVALNAESFDG